ncbi:sialidase family protein [Fodinicola acaciae]|uniref:sialidase family protein n=1 Tax=Fodinicola acaciae TaxID=2681555 RepID=UPI0013D6E88F|nr:sialidase family protein [Fodinicola acaciae]
MTKTLLFDGHADVTVARRDGRWWMALPAMREEPRSIVIREAHLPPGAAIDDDDWTISGEELAAPADGWDATGYHCPSYVHERIYYASSSGWTDITGPYRIGFLEMHDGGWQRLPEPVFQAERPFERGTVLEPNLLRADDRWRMWYATGLSTSDRQVIAYAESADGVNWQDRQVVLDNGEFDAAVVETDDGFTMVSARHTIAGPPPDGGLYLSHSEDGRKWSEPECVLRTLDGTPWHSAGVWKPSVVYDQGRLVIFFNGAAPPDPGSHFPKLAVGRLTLDHPMRP